MTDDNDVQRMTDNIVARFANVHFMARKLQVDSAQWGTTDSGSKEELAQLLDVRYGLWQAAAVTYTPTGTATQQTDHTVISGRTISATPHRTTITLDLLPAVDYQSFTLDSDVLGVLGGSTDYDNSSFTYDGALPYDGNVIDGNRLG